MIVLEKDIPCPPRHITHFYPWATMDVGESFVFPDFVQFPHETARAASARHSPKQFTTRKTLQGFRCWRVA